MNAATRGTAVPTVPQGEWNFHDPPIPPKEIGACFWWEYIRMGVDDNLRFALSRLPLPLRYSRAFVRAATPRGQNPGFFDPYLLAKIVQEGRGPLFRKRTPWRDLPVQEQEDLIRGIRSAICPLIVIYHTSKGGVKVVVGRGDVEHHEDYSQPVGSRGRLDLRVDWSFKDGQIAGDFSKVLDLLRPDEWSEINLRSRRSLHDRNLKFWQAALGWLGVHRLHNFFDCSWAKIQANYIDANERDLRKQAEWAKSIIAYMQDGDCRHLDNLPAGQSARRRPRN